MIGNYKWNVGNYVVILNPGKDIMERLFLGIA